MHRRLEMTLLGLVGGAAGLVAKRLTLEVWNRFYKPGNHRRKRSWSLVGEQHLPDEGSPEASARLLYTALVGRPPTERTKKRLATALDWSFGASLGVLYALARGEREDLDLRGGVTMAIGVWALVDELGLSLLGLQDAPTSYPTWTHVRALTEHVVFGAAMAATTQQIAAAR